MGEGLKTLAAWYPSLWALTLVQETAALDPGETIVASPRRGKTLIVVNPRFMRVCGLLATASTHPPGGHAAPNEVGGFAVKKNSLDLNGREGRAFTGCGQYRKTKVPRSIVASRTLIPYPLCRVLSVICCHRYNNAAEPSRPVSSRRMVPKGGSDLSRSRSVGHAGVEVSVVTMTPEGCWQATRLAAKNTRLDNLRRSPNPKALPFIPRL